MVNLQRSPFYTLLKKHSVRVMVVRCIKVLIKNDSLTHRERHYYVRCNTFLSHCYIFCNTKYIYFLLLKIEISSTLVSCPTLCLLSIACSLFLDPVTYVVSMGPLAIDGCSRSGSGWEPVIHHAHLCSVGVNVWVREGLTVAVMLSQDHMLAVWHALK